jgi:thiol:disulfide interchange protein
VELVLIYVGIKSELVVAIIEVLTQMQGGFHFAIVPCILPMLP